MHGYETKDHKWNPAALAGVPPGHQLVNSAHLPVDHPMNAPPEAGGLTPLTSLETKNGIQLINSSDCSSNHGSVLMNGTSNSSNGSSATTLINPLINSGNGPGLLTGLTQLTSFEHGDLRRPESVLSALRPDSPNDLSAISD